MARILTVSLTLSELTEVYNEGKECTLKALVRLGWITEEQAGDLATHIAIVARPKGFFGKLWDKLRRGPMEEGAYAIETLILDGVLRPAKPAVDEPKLKPPTLRQFLAGTGGLKTAMETVIHARDHHAEHGTYPSGVLTPDRDFDDWAADLLDEALKKYKAVTELNVTTHEAR